MNKQKPTRQVNDYVLLFSAGAALSVVFLWLASYIFPEGEIIGGRRVFENIPKSIQYIFYILSAASVYICGYLFSLRAKNWSRGTEEKRKVKLSKRILSFFDGILMRTTLRFKAAGVMPNPYAGAFKSGWNLGQEFVNMYLGHGGEFFKSGSAQPNVNNEKGVAALNVIKKLTELSNPDFLTQDTNAVKEEWESGNVALMHVWNSGAASLLDDEGDQAIKADTRLAPSPSVGGGSKPATTLWWDGIGISTNTSDENAEASFRALVGAASSSELANDNPNATVWLIKGYTPGDTAGPVVDAANRGATPYPSFPHMSLMHGALSSELVEFLQGNESAEKALADVEAAYVAKATEQGFL